MNEREREPDIDLENMFPILEGVDQDNRKIPRIGLCRKNPKIYKNDTNIYGFKYYKFDEDDIYYYLLELKKKSLYEIFFSKKENAGYSLQDIEEGKIVGYFNFKGFFV